MGFQEAIRAFFSNYVKFDGRSVRSEYWWPVLVMTLINYVVILPIQVLISEGLGGIISLIFSLAILLPSIAVAIRRLHDTDRSGWWYLLIFIPILGCIALIIFFASKGTVGPNRFGSDPLGSDASVFN